jgi:outer membrane protein assembly factor BamA
VKKEIFEYDGDINTGLYHSNESSGNFTVSRWIDTPISRGWTAGAGLSVEDINYYEQSGSGLAYNDNFTLALNLGLDRNDTQEYPFHRDGERYGYAISLALPQLGSDSSFTRHYLYYRRYRPLEFAHSNLNTQFQFYAANGEGDTYSIGNSTLLRGYDDDYAEGNAMFLANVEYHQHMSGYPQLRGVLFTDIGNAWASVSDIDLGDTLTSVGIGLRWRVQSFVDVTLRMDYAYALSADTTKLTLNTTASF